MGPYEGLITAGIGLLGTIIGATISWLVASYRSRTRLTLDLHRELNTEAVLAARNRADTVVLQHPDKDLDDLWDILKVEERNDIWTVIHFYQRLYIAIKFKQVRTDLVCELFGDVFHWWFINCFERHLLPVNRDSSRQVAALKQWFDSNCSAEDIERWTTRNTLNNDDANSKAV